MHGGVRGAPPPEYLALLADQDGAEANGLRFPGSRPASLAGAPGVELAGLVAAAVAAHR